MNAIASIKKDNGKRLLKETEEALEYESATLERLIKTSDQFCHDAEQFGINGKKLKPQGAIGIIYSLLARLRGREV